ncbi:hypothetical protein Tco_0601790 [Tanacetum coccineum]
MDYVVLYCCIDATPQTVHIIPPDDDYIAPAISLTLDKQLNEFGEECSDITRVAKKANGNPDKDEQELLDIKTYDWENELAQDGDFLYFSTGLLHLICLKARLKGVSCSNSILSV